MMRKLEAESNGQISQIIALQKALRALEPTADRSFKDSFL
jgi:hypothetical protein